MTNVSREVVDEDGRVWRLAATIGGGGQGRVYAVAGHALAVKILRDRDPVARAALRDRLAAVRRLYLEALPVARPIALLRAPQVGYVMRLIDGVHPLDDLVPSPRIGDVPEWYLETGGLRRRLRVLARLADVLEQLHARALVYGDLSLTNVLISADLAGDVVWLIDPDNLRLCSAPGRFIITPGFGAPELQQRAIAAPDTLTDAHALAVVIYQILTLKHPLTGGVLVDQSPPIAEHEALRGEIPWVAHPQDGRNEQLAGLPWQIVMTRRAFDLARRTFEGGLTDPKLRATAGDWARELRWAAGMCLACWRCEHTYLAAGNPLCPWCEASRPRVAIVRVGVCNERGDQNLDKRLPHLVGGVNDAISIHRWQAFGDRNPGSQDEVVAILRVHQDRVTYEPQVAGTRIGKDDADLRAVEHGRVVPLPARGEGLLPWTIHFGEPGALHRVARVQLIAGATV